MKTSINFTKICTVLIFLYLKMSAFNQLSAQCSIPVMDPIANQTFNASDVVPAILFTSNIPGANFRWTRSSMPGSINFGSGIPSFTANNSSCTVPFVETFTVVAFLGDILSTPPECFSTPVQFTITVNPKPIPVVDPLANLIFNPGDVVPAIPFTSNIPGANFRWTRSSAPGATNFGSGIPSFTATNTSCTVPIVETFTVSAFLGDFLSTPAECFSTPVQFTITVNPNPIPVVDPLANLIFNPGDVVPTILFTSNMPGANFRWTRSSAPGATAFGSGILSFTASNSSCTVPLVETFTVTAFFGDLFGSTTPADCFSTPVQFTITINPNPIPIVNPMPNLTYNPGEVIPTILFTSNMPGARFRWTRSTQPGSTNFGGGIPSFTATNSSCTVPLVETFTVTAFFGDLFGSTTPADCFSAPVQFTITVKDIEPPVVTCPENKTVNMEQGVCYATASTVNAGTATATDNCSATVVGIRSDGQSLDANYPGGITTIIWTATDPMGNTSSCLQTITVNDNQPPIFTTPLTVNKPTLWPPNHKMQDIVLSYQVEDNCGCIPVVTVSSNEPVNGTGDGDTAPDWDIIDAHHVKLRAERAANGNGRIYTITINCTDLQNNTATNTVEVKVAHNITGPKSGKPFKIGSTVPLTGVFWDKPGNTHSAKWLVDGIVAANGIVTEPTGNLNGKVTGMFKTNTAGVYKLQMNVTDQTGVTSFANTNEDIDAIVVIYDPSGGYTYGGGWYQSQPGTLAANANASGKSSYGFTVNYRNSGKPKGEAQFEFKMGDFEFNALNYDYLVISGAKAQFKGTGKITGGQSGIAFIMTVKDGNLDGTGIDKVRMKIYNKNTGTVYYDNQPGASDAADPVTPVGSNSVIVVQGAGVAPTIVNTTGAEINEDELANQMQVKVHPNPTGSSFLIAVSTDDQNGKILLQVYDQNGRFVEARNNITAGSNVLIGDLYKPGVYYLRVVQGKNNREIKLVKLSN